MIGLFVLLGYYELHGYEDLGLSFCVDVRSPFSDIYLGMELLGQNGSSMFNYLRNYQTFPKQCGHSIYIPHAKIYNNYLLGWIDNFLK